MQIVYIHGLNSDHNAKKGQLLAEFCQKHFPQITVKRPDLNHAPEQVEKILADLIAQDPDTGLVGSSLGGFFATLMSNETGAKAVLINPSLDPANSLRRFFDKNGADEDDQAFDQLPDDYVAMTTDGGWQLKKADIAWFAKHRPAKARYPQNFLVLLKQGDELLDYQDAVDYFSQSNDDASHTQPNVNQPNVNQQSHLVIEPGGDHNMSDFDTKLAQVVQFLFGLTV